MRVESPDEFEEREISHTFIEMVDTGLLWLINSTALWPHGYSLGLEQGRDGEIYGWNLAYNGEAVITSGDEMAQKRYQAVQALMAEAREKHGQ